MQYCKKCKEPISGYNIRRFKHLCYDCYLELKLNENGTIEDKLYILIIIFSLITIIIGILFMLFNQNGDMLKQLI